MNVILVILNVAGLIAFPANVILVALFRFTKPRPTKKIYTIQQTQTNAKKDAETEMEDDLLKQKELLETDKVDKKLINNESQEPEANKGTYLITVPRLKNDIVFRFRSYFRI